MSPLQPLYAQVADLNALRAHLATLLPQDGKDVAGLADTDASPSTKDVKIYLGGGFWADFTAAEGLEVVGRQVAVMENQIREAQLHMLGIIPTPQPSIPSLASASSSLASGSTGAAPPASTPTAASSRISAPTASGSSNAVKPLVAKAGGPFNAAKTPSPTPAPSSTKPVVNERVDMIPLLLPSGKPQLSPEDSLPLYELRLAVDGLLDSAPGGRGRLAPLPKATDRERASRKKERERVWEEAEREEMEEEERLAKSSAGVQAPAPAPTPTSHAPTPATPTPAVLEPSPATPTPLSTPSPSPLSQQTAPSSASEKKQLATLQKAIDSLDLPADQEGDVSSNHLEEILSEDGLPISRIAIPASESSTRSTPAPPAPLPSGPALTDEQAARRKAERDRLLDLLEAEEEEAASAPLGKVREVVRLPEVSNPVVEEPKAEGKQPERRKSVQWSEVDQVKEFDFREAVAVASDTSSLPSAPVVEETPAPTKKEEKKAPIVKDVVVERPIMPVLAPGQRTPQTGKAQEGQRQAGTERYQPPVSATPKLSATLSEASSEVVDAKDDDDNDDDDDDGSYQLSDVASNDDEDQLADLGMDMDQKLMMREAAVSYYRMKGSLASRGGLEGILRGMGEGGSGDEPEFVPLNATLASDLDEVRLAAPETHTNDSKFNASNSTLSSIPLPTLIPGGSAQGYLKNAIRVGRLENGELVVGGDESDEEAEEGETEEAGKDALMWGMVGGVVVRPENLEDKSEEKLKVDFYQSEATVTVSLFVKGLSKEDVSIDFSPFSVEVQTPSNPITVGPFSGKIIPDLCNYRVSSMKVELTLFKASVGERWQSVEANQPPRPYSSTPSAPLTGAPSTAPVVERFGPPPPPPLHQEEKPPPRAQAEETFSLPNHASDKASQFRASRQGSSSSASAFSPAPAAAIAPPKSILRTPSSTVVPSGPAFSSTPKTPSEPTQLVGTPMERPTIAPSESTKASQAQNGAAGSKGAEKKMSKFRMRQLGLTDNNDM